MLQRFGVEATAMMDLIQAQLEEAGASGLRYPSPSGKDSERNTHLVSGELQNSVT